MPGETESPIPEPVKNPSPEVDDPEKRRRLVGPLKRLFGGFRSVQTEIIQTPISRRTVLKAGIAATILTGLGIGIREAKKWFDPTGKLDNFKTGGVGEQGRQTWKKFLNRFKMGNADIPGKYKNLPKIKEKYVTPKAT